VCRFQFPNVYHKSLPPGVLVAPPCCCVNLRVALFVPPCTALHAPFEQCCVVSALYLHRLWQRCVVVPHFGVRFVVLFLGRTRVARTVVATLVGSKFGPKKRTPGGPHFSGSLSDPQFGGHTTLPRHFHAASLIIPADCHPLLHIAVEVCINVSCWILVLTAGWHALRC